MSSIVTSAPKASIVVLCFNGLKEVTRPCLESLLAHTPADTCELIVVDNASADGTPEYLQTLASSNPNVRLQLNAVNKGYAGGNNDGIRMACGEFIVLLNNDTLVSSGWLNPLLHLLQTNAEVGLVGPITNSAGNEQRVDLPGLDEANFSQIAKAYTERQVAHWFATNKLGFFCVAMRRSLVEEIGYLDEKFGIGMFEDDDYCQRAAQKGFRLAVVEDSFVFHKGSVSFKKLNAADYAQIFKANRDYFYQKHAKVWTFADIATAIWAKIDADLQSAANSRSAAALDRAMVRCNGMSGALSHSKEVELSLSEVDGQPVAALQLAEKHKQLMEISDWATSLKVANAHLNAELGDLKLEVSNIRKSWIFRVIGYLNRRSV